MQKKSHTEINVKCNSEKTYEVLSDGSAFKSLGKKERGALYRKMDKYFQPGYEHCTMKRWFLYMQLPKKYVDYIKKVMLHCIFEVMKDAVYSKIKENTEFDDKIKVFRERKSKNTKAVDLYTNLLKKYHHE